jgi:hypothetical protein
LSCLCLSDFFADADLDLVVKFMRRFFKRARRQTARNKAKDDISKARALRGAMATELAAAVAARRRRVPSGATRVEAESEQSSDGGDGGNKGDPHDRRSSPPDSVDSPHSSLPSSSSSSLESLALPGADARSPLAVVFPGLPRQRRAPSALAKVPESVPSTSSLSSEGPTARVKEPGSQPREEEQQADESPYEPEVKASIEFRLLKRDATYIWVRGVGSAISCPFDGETKICFSMVSVEERRSLRSQLEDERNVVSSVVDQLPVAVAIATPDGRQVAKLTFCCRSSKHSGGGAPSFTLFVHTMLFAGPSGTRR